jgi:hypothetical protein
MAPTNKQSLCCQTINKESIVSNELGGLQGLKKYMVLDTWNAQIGYASCKSPEEAIETIYDEHDERHCFRISLSTHAVLNGIDSWSYLQDGTCRFVVTTDNKIVG